LYVLAKVISAGQAGPHQAGGRATRAFGILTGGFLRLGFLHEGGARPEFGVVEMLTSDAPLWLSSVEITSAKTTLGCVAR
jgi:hypothetical protein